jgi:integration host factor subunit beta
MTKSELIDAIVEQTKMTRVRAEQVVNCIFDTMVDSLKRGEGIEIRGFGSFTVRNYEAYSGRNPRTGEPKPVPPKRLPFFKVGKELKALVDDSRKHGPIVEDDDQKGRKRRRKSAAPPTTEPSASYPRSSTTSSGSSLAAPRKAVDSE